MASLMLVYQNQEPTTEIHFFLPGQVMSSEEPQPTLIQVGLSEVQGCKRKSTFMDIQSMGATGKQKVLLLGHGTAGSSCQGNATASAAGPRAQPTNGAEDKENETLGSMPVCPFTRSAQDAQKLRSNKVRVANLITETHRAEFLKELHSDDIQDFVGYDLQSRRNGISRQSLSHSKVKKALTQLGILGFDNQDSA